MLCGDGLLREYGTLVAGEASKYSLSHLEREFRYLLYFRTNVHNLNLEVELLTAKRAEVIRWIEEATRNDEVIRETVKAWLKAVDEFLGKATKFNGKAALIDRWFKGWVLCSRFSTGRGSQKLIEGVKRLLEHAEALGEKVADRRPVQELVYLDGVLTSNGDFKDFGSRVTTANQVIQALQDDKVSLLGIYGMPGVGKTTLVSALPSYVKKHKLFDEVVLVKLTQTPRIEVIQSDIAEGLGLKFEDADTLGTRALRLLARLSQPQKTLIVFDNVWRRVELSDVGIPRGLNNCKIVFTTRDTDVCNSMGSGKSRIKLELLSSEESWDLFQENAGDVKDSLALPSFARDISNECQGLPLLIVTLGRALYGKNQNVWERGLESLQNSTLIGNCIFTGMPQVFAVMKLSYDFLDSEEVKFCFLLCCLFPDGYHITRDQLFHYMMGDIMFRKASTLQAARCDLDMIIDKLISASLLLQAKSGCIMMHDVVRDVALAIASEGGDFIVKAGMDLVDWSDNMQLANCRRLSFMTTRGDRGMSWSLPRRIQAAQLLTLSFRGNENVEKISDEFFEDMKNLSTVDLSYTAIKVLPSSLVSHANLCTLLLEGCFYLNDVYLSNNMKKLELLSLRYSGITSFIVSPELTTLKLLDLSYTSKLTHIPQNVISRFLKLEELYMFDGFRAWEPEPREKDTSSFMGKGAAEEDEESASLTMKEESREESAMLYEVTLLRHLTSLELHVGNLGCLFQDIPNWERLRQFKIAVGVIEDFCPFGIDDGMQMEKSMYIELKSDVVADWVKFLLGRTNFLLLKGAQSLIDLLRLSPGQEQQLLCELQVLILSDIQSDSSLLPCELLVRLQNLNKLVIRNCVYLEILIELEDQAVYMDASSSSRNNMVKFSNVPASSVFPNLTYLRVCTCTELEYLFPMRIIRLLHQLQILHISKCHKMKMVIVRHNAEDVVKAGDEKTILSKLRVLSLEGLKCLSRIIQQEMHLEFPILDELTVNDCGGLEKLPFGAGSVPQLTKLVVDDDDWFDELIWDDRNVKQRLVCLLNSLQLKGCGSLRDVELHDQWHPTLRSVRVTDYKGETLIPCSFLKNMPHLKKLVIKNSRELQMIDFGEEEGSAEEEVHSAGPSSSSANTSKFSKSPSYPVFANLSCLRVSGCSGLQYLCPVRALEALLQLEKLYIHDCSEMEMVITHEDGDVMILPKLRILNLTRLGRLSRIVLESGHLELPALEELKVKECEKLIYQSNINTAKLDTALQWDNQKIEYELDVYFLRVDQLANSLYLKRCTSLEVIELDDSWHPAFVRSLNVDGFGGATLVYRSLQRRPWNLDRLQVTCCPNLEAIIEYGGENKAGETSISASSSSSVKNRNLSKLWSSPVFSNLTFLVVTDCEKLRYLLPMEVVRNMAQLKILYVQFCTSMETIIEYENVKDGCDPEKDRVLLPKLEELILWNLPQLWSFVGKHILFDWPSLTYISVCDCLDLEKLPLGSVPRLQWAYLTPKEWSDELEWEDEEVKLHVQRTQRV